MATSFQYGLAKSLLSPGKLRLWMIRHLPMAVPLGIVISELDETHCKVDLKFRSWLKNPFGSLFWAVMGMAGELSTGALVYAYASNKPVRFILTEIEGKFIKKVTGKSYYICQAGPEVSTLIENLSPLEATSIVMPVVAYNELNEEVANFKFTWQFQVK